MRKIDKESYIKQFRDRIDALERETNDRKIDELLEGIEDIAKLAWLDHHVCDIP